MRKIEGQNYTMSVNSPNSFTETAYSHIIFNHYTTGEKISIDNIDEYVGICAGYLFLALHKIRSVFIRSIIFLNKILFRSDNKTVYLLVTVEHLKRKQKIPNFDNHPVNKILR